MKRFLVVSAIVGVVLGLMAAFVWRVSAAPAAQVSGRCGDEPPPDYGLSYDLRQPHWTVGWEGYVSQRTVDQVDAILDRLDADMTAQTMILFLPSGVVGNRVNCAVHFLRYMGLGQPEGPHKDNGFVFLVVVDGPAGNRTIDVHYGVGLGLPALTAQELTPLNRLAEQTYTETGSLDEALLALVREYDRIARENYGPVVTPTQPRLRPTFPPLATEAPMTVELPEGPLGVTTLCCMLCLVSLAVLFLLWLFTRLAAMGGPFIGGGGGFGGPFSGGGGGWSGGGGGWSGGGGFGGGRSRGGFGGGFGGRTRGGSGSGRSGRGN